MKQRLVIILISIMCITNMIACSNKDDTNNSTEYIHTDEFKDIDYNTVIDNVNTNINETHSENVDNTGNNTEGYFEIKENTVPEYTDEELKEIEDNYNNNAAPNYILDDEIDSDLQDNNSEDTTGEVVKQVEINGEIFEIYVNE